MGSSDKKNKTQKTPFETDEFNILLEHGGRILSNVIINVDIRREMRTEADVSQR